MSSAGRSRTRLGGSADETPQPLPAGRASGPSPDNETPRGRSRCRISALPPERPCGRSRECTSALLRGRFGLCPGSPTAFHRHQSPRRSRRGPHPPKSAPCRESPRSSAFRLRQYGAKSSGNDLSRPPATLGFGPALTTRRIRPVRPNRPEFPPHQIHRQLAPGKRNSRSRNA